MKKLSYECSWEYDRYSIDNKPILTLTKVKIKGKEYKVTKRSVTIPYNDMGHTYTATSDHYFVEEEVFGKKMKFDLNEIIRDITVYPLEYTTKES